MDSTDLPQQVFTEIFLQPERFTKDTVQLIIDWNDSLDPSLNIVKAQFNKFISNPQNALALSSNVLNTLKAMTDLKCPRNFIRGYLATIKSILDAEESPAKAKLESSLKEYESKWKQVNLDVLQPYFQALSLKDKICREQINLFIEEMINSKKYSNCLDFIKFIGVDQNKQNIQKLMSKMSNKKDASKAADFVKRLQLDPKNYPALGERLYKNTARHFLAKHGWQYSEQIFEEYPQALACVVQDLIYKKKFAQARSIWSRHPLWDFLQKQESKEYLKSQYKEELPINTIISNDTFAPPNLKYISLSDLGIKEEDVIWVQQNTQGLDAILNDIASADILGIDTESIVGQTKFQKVDEAAIIQVSTGKKVYIFDGFKSANPKIAQAFAQAFSEKKIVGHSFTNDTQGIAKAFGIKDINNEHKQLQIKKLIDICNVYKSMNENAKYSSLAHITKQVLGKQLCKDQTLTNWKRRPLRKNQLHYSALDAQIVVQIYSRWCKQYGAIVHYHAKIDDDDL